MHNDHAPVFTNYGWMAQILLNDSARIFYGLNGARDAILAQDNPEMESAISRFTPALASGAREMEKKIVAARRSDIG